MKGFSLWHCLAEGIWHLLVADRGPKSAYLCQFSPFGGPVWCSGDTLENSFFSIFDIFGSRQGGPWGRQIAIWTRFKLRLAVPKSWT